MPPIFERIKVLTSDSKFWPYSLGERVFCLGKPIAIFGRGTKAHIGRKFVVAGCFRNKQGEWLVEVEYPEGLVVFKHDKVFRSLRERAKAGAVKHEL